MCYIAVKTIWGSYLVEARLMKIMYRLTHYSRKRLTQNFIAFSSWISGSSVLHPCRQFLFVCLFFQGFRICLSHIWRCCFGGSAATVTVSCCGHQIAQSSLDVTVFQSHTQKKSSFFSFLFFILFTFTTQCLKIWVTGCIFWLAMFTKSTQ